MKPVCVLFFLSLFLVSSCVKQGRIGPQGPPGASIGDSIISGVFQAPPLGWDPQGQISTDFTFWQKVPAITKYRLANSVIFLFVYDKNVLRPIPYSDADGSINVGYQAGVITIEDHLAVANQIVGAANFKYVIIPQGKVDSLKSSGVNLGVYRDVRKALFLKD